MAQRTGKAAQLEQRQALLSVMDDKFRYAADLAFMARLSDLEPRAVGHRLRQLADEGKVDCEPQGDRCVWRLREVA